MSAQLIELDVDCVGSQNPADQPTAAEWEALSAYLRERRPHNEALIEAYRREVAEAALSKMQQEAGQTV